MKVEENKSKKQQNNRVPTQVDKVKKEIHKDKPIEDKEKRKRLIREEEEDIQENPKKGRKITIKIQRGDRVVLGNHDKQKVIDFILLDRDEIKQKGEEEQKQIEMELTQKRLKLKGKLIGSRKSQLKNKEKVITLDDDEEDNDVIAIDDDDEDDIRMMGHMEQEDVDEIIKQNKKITQKVSPFLCQELSATKDPRQNRLVQEIQHILQQQPEYKLNLILDLDETLVNSVWVNSENQNKLEEIYRYKMPLNKNILTIYYNNNEGVQKEFISIMRPHLKEFITEVKKYFNIHVYSHGRKEYVLKLLDKLDPRRDLFNRNNIFKNDGQVSLKTQKDIKNIIVCNSPAAHEAALKQTIIIDDIYEVWLEETLKNVVPIKRFQPLNDFLLKSNQCTIFMNHNKQFIKFPKSHQEIFQDIDIQDSSNVFLKGLQRYLTSTALQFYNKKLIKKDQSADVREYLTYQTLMVMNQLDLNLSLLESDEIYDVYKYIALTMGANINLKNYRYALVNKESASSFSKRMNQMKEQNPGLTFINVQWLVDSYFLHYQLDKQNYLI